MARVLIKYARVPPRGAGCYIFVAMLAREAAMEWGHERRNSGAKAESVTDVAHCLNEMVASIVGLRTHPPDMNVHGAGTAEIVVIPHFL